MSFTNQFSDSSWPVLILTLQQRLFPVPQKQFQKMKQEDWRALIPLIYCHVNPHGMFRLDMNERMHIEGEDVSA